MLRKAGPPADPRTRSGNTCGGNGLVHSAAARGGLNMSVAEERRERLARMRLYLITGDRGDEVETARIVEAALEGGATVVQLRKKSTSMLEQYRLALALRILTREHEALLIINDHADLAIAVDADGVHLGQDDLPPDAV